MSQIALDNISVFLKTPINDEISQINLALRLFVDNSFIGEDDIPLLKLKIHSLINLLNEFLEGEFASPEKLLDFVSQNDFYSHNQEFLKSLNGNCLNSLIKEHLMFAFAVKALADNNDKSLADILAFLDYSASSYLNYADIDEIRILWINTFSDTNLLFQNWYDKTIANLLGEVINDE